MRSAWVLLGLCVCASVGAQEPAEHGFLNRPGARASDALVFEYRVRFGDWHPYPHNAVQLAGFEECRMFIDTRSLGEIKSCVVSGYVAPFEFDGQWSYTMDLVPASGSPFTITRTGQYFTRQAVPDAVFDLHKYFEGLIGVALVGLTFWGYSMGARE